MSRYDAWRTGDIGDDGRHPNSPSFADDDAPDVTVTPAERLLWNLSMRRMGRPAGDPILDLPLIRRAFLRNRRNAESYGLIRQAVVSPVLLPDAKLDNWRLQEQFIATAAYSAADLSAYYRKNKA